MINIDKFLNAEKSMIIAPAGHGKTHTITEAIEYCNETKKILVLTHTHAGVASIKEKIQKKKISSKKYSIDTICSFAINLMNTFVSNRGDIPNPEDGKQYFDYALKACRSLLKAKPIYEVIKNTYSHIIVDEYQDCSIVQHEIILLLSSAIKTHILGDQLQGIFDFNGDLVDLDSNEQMAGFIDNKQELTTPWRWNNANAHNLGSALNHIRAKLINKESVDLNEYSPYITTKLISNLRQNYAYNQREINLAIWAEINETNSLLVIDPISARDTNRIDLAKKIPRLRILNSVDDKNYYLFCKNIDNCIGSDLIGCIVDMMSLSCKKSAVDKWFTGNKLIKKRSTEDKAIASQLQEEIDAIIATKSKLAIVNLINKIISLPDNMCCRYQLVNDVIKALKEAKTNNVSVLEAMGDIRNVVRHQGRKVVGRSIGTTLLTKGLEFDVVIILNAHLFKDPKNLYVALTRACRKLVIITDNVILNPYK